MAWMFVFLYTLQNELIFVLKKFGFPKILYSSGSIGFLEQEILLLVKPTINTYLEIQFRSIII